MDLQQTDLYKTQRARVENHVKTALAQDRSLMGLIRLALQAQRSCQENTDSFNPQDMACLECDSGCDYCCHPPVSAAVPEVANIVAYVFNHLPEAEQDRIMARVEQVYARVHPMSGPERTSSNIACPYLAEGKCSIYPVRPLACRGFNSTSRADCQTVFEQTRKDHQIPAYVPLLASAQGLKEGLLGGLRASGLKTPLVDLVRASHKLFAELEENLERWARGADVFSDCKPF